MPRRRFWLKRGYDMRTDRNKQRESREQRKPREQFEPLPALQGKDPAMTDSYTVGIDVGGTKIEAVLVDGMGVVRACERMAARGGADRVVADCARLARMVAGPYFPEVQAVGIGIPGQVDPTTGHVANVVNLAIVDVELARLVSQALGGVPVHVENDVNAAALGAAHMLDRGSETVAFLNFGTGLAAGLVYRGRLLHGASGSAGEIGHIPVDPNRFECPCGQRGCLETVCSGAAVATLWPTGKDDPPMPDLLAKAKAGDPAAQRVLAIVKHAMGDAVQMVTQSVDPELIVVGGGMAKTGQPLLDAIGEEVQARGRRCPFLESLHIAGRLRLAPPDEPIGAVGAALAAVHVSV